MPPSLNPFALFVAFVVNLDPHGAQGPWDATHVFVDRVHDGEQTEPRWGTWIDVPTPQGSREARQPWAAG